MKLKKIKKQALSVLCAAVLLFAFAALGTSTDMEAFDFGSFTARAAEVVDSGTYTDNLEWTLDNAGVLTIRGTGEMKASEDFPRKPYPWEAYKDSIKTAVIEDGVTSIGMFAFYRFNALTEAIIPDSVTSIGQSAFNGCESLTSITVPDGITRIEPYTFADCTALSSINLPESVTSIGISAFNNCKSLEAITIPDSVTSIEQYAFIDCEKLEKIIIPAGVTVIDYCAFMNCKALTSVSIPDSITVIKDEAFSKCESLRSIRIPKAVESIGKDAFLLCGGLESITVEKGNAAYKGSGNCLIDVQNHKLIRGSNNSVIPSDASVKSIGPDAFYGCKSLSEISIPNNITSIGDRAFSHCQSLRSVVILESISRISKFAFCACKALTDVSIADGVTYIDDYAFDSCAALRSINIPDSVTQMGIAVFDGCSSLTEVKLSNNLTAIPDSTFTLCDSLPEIVIPDGVTVIGDNAFCYCEALTSVVIPNSVEEIGREAFRDCYRMQKINIPDSVTKIGSEAFLYCSSLFEIKIPKNVEVLDESTLANTRMLKSVTIFNPDCQIDDTALDFNDDWYKNRLPGLIIRGHAQSTAETFAEKYGFRFVPFTENQTPHTCPLKNVAAIPAVCGNEGNIEYWCCESCNMYFLDKAGIYSINKEDITPAGNYNIHFWELGYLVAEQPSCSHEGRLEHWWCTSCERAYMDENGTIEIENVTLDKTDHIDKNGDNHCDDCGTIISNSFLAKIRAFFQRIINMFKNLFS